MPSARCARKRLPPRLRLSLLPQGAPVQPSSPSKASNGSVAAADKRSPAPTAPPVVGAAAAAAAPAASAAASAAWAYQGAPRPPNEEERLALLRSLGVLDSEQGPDQFDAITRLLCAVFNVPIALVSLVDAGEWLLQALAPAARSCSIAHLPWWHQYVACHVLTRAGLAAACACPPPRSPRAERQWFKSVQGLGTCIQTGRAESFCAWTLLPESPCMLVRSMKSACCWVPCKMLALQHMSRTGSDWAHSGCLGCEWFLQQEEPCLGLCPMVAVLLLVHPLSQLCTASRNASCARLWRMRWRTSGSVKTRW